MLELRDVGARDEGLLAGALEDDDPDIVVVLGGMQELDEMVEVVEAQRVVLGRPVEHEPRDGSVGLQQHGIVHAR